MPTLEAIQSVTVVGAGHCGRQIAHLLGRVGVPVTCYEPSQEQLIGAQAAFYTSFGPNLTEALNLLNRCSLDDSQTSSAPLQPPTTAWGMRWTTDLALASQSDLIIEAVPEYLPLKRRVMEAFAKATSPYTILATNSSYLPPSSIFRGLPNPERFAALHFHSPPWYATAVDVMPAPRTAHHVLSRLVQLIERIGLVPILMRREFPGYIFNNLLNPLLVKAMELAERQVCSPAEIEYSWKSITQMPVGPFGMMLQIGLPSLRTILASAVSQINDPSTLRAYRFIQQWNGDLSIAPATQQLVEPFSSASVHFANTFEAYEVQWHRTNDFDPIQDTIIQRIRLAFLGSDITAPIHQLANDQIYVWPFSFPAQHIDLQKIMALAITDPSAELTTRILSLKHWQNTQAEREAPGRTWIISLRGTSTSPISTLGPSGATGLIRALWLEQIATRQTENTNFANKTAQSSVNFLEIDLNSFAQPSASPTTVETSTAEPAGDEADELIRSFAHTHQRYHAGKWQIPKLSRLVTSKTWTPAKQLLDGSRWLISGGGRGITAHLAILLGLHGARLDILGRTPLPEIPWDQRSESDIKEARLKVIREAAHRRTSIPAAQALFDNAVELSRNIATLQANGTDFRYHQVDVSNRQEVWSLFESLCAKGIRINGFLHGAGFEQTTLLRKKSTESIEKTIASKVGGATNLQSLINGETRWFISCGSLSGFFGGVGQVDYASANCFLAEQACNLKEQWPNMQSLAIGWPGWEQIGMAARASSKWALGKAGHKLMSIAEGSQHFISLIEKQVNGLVLICNPAEIPPYLLCQAQR
jgi:3-hydroxyacyl-CoA dehydrogenase/NAD(P)-dependent dehydrogenase (short-subunit alcohol dehydrogenase family)